MFFPAGATGPAFLVSENYAVLKEYNNSDAYAIAVGYLADRINGGAPIKAAWPADDRPLSVIPASPCRKNYRRSAIR